MTLDPTDEPVAFHDLPASAFPFTVEYHKAPPSKSPGPIDTVIVTGPGAIRVPAMGWPTWVRIRSADGSIQDYDPPAKDPCG